MIETGSRVKVIDILNKTEGKHLTKFIGCEGEVWSYNYKTDEDKINDRKRCKVKLDKIEGTYYFIADGELEEV
jgi:hypothetical protein